MEETHQLESLGCPSGESRRDALEHLPVSYHDGPQSADRGRQREQKQRAENHGNINTGNFHNPLRKNGQDRALQETLNQVQVASLLIDSDAGFDARLGKKRHRRRTSKKKRNWKPYNKLSWEEKKALEERETLRASRMREEMFAKGLPVAPYNTTQFLMDEHDREEPDLNTEARRSLGVGGRPEETGSEEEVLDNEQEDDDDDGSGGGSDGIGRPGNAGGEFLQRDFSETYEMYHVETLQNMSKQELVQEYLELEKCMSRLEEENNRLRRAVEPGAATESVQVRLQELEVELERLRAENSELHLKSLINKKTLNQSLI
uniref:HEXIM P-TEFb complex subunit 1 n=1 Tax=Oryzias latipes TaxID=8090 RepID=A0A3P9H336_ORYLA